jgi:hypothetical protein
MKKIFLFVVAAASVYLTVTAQEKRAGPEKKGFLIVSAGPSFPLGDFKSRTREDYISTFTRTGFSADLQGGYHFVTSFGITGSVFYNFYSYNEQRLKEQLGIPAEVPMIIDHWKYYVIVVGPMVTDVITSRISVDFNVMTGIVNANSPKLTVGTNGGTEVIITEDWAAAIPIRLSGGMRIQLGRDGYFDIGINYFHAEPEFRSTFFGEDLVKHQALSTFSTTAGIGLRF